LQRSAGPAQSGVSTPVSGKDATTTRRRCSTTRTRWSWSTWMRWCSCSRWCDSCSVVLLVALEAEPLVLDEEVDELDADCEPSVPAAEGMPLAALGAGKAPAAPADGAVLVVDELERATTPAPPVEPLREEPEQTPPPHDPPRATRRAITRDATVGSLARRESNKTAPVATLAVPTQGLWRSLGRPSPPRSRRALHHLSLWCTGSS